MKGTDFDNEYNTQQKQAHQDTISAFQTEASNGADADVKQFAAENLPILQKHLDMLNGRGDMNDTHVGMEK